MKPSLLQSLPAGQLPLAIFQRLAKLLQLADSIWDLLVHFDALALLLFHLIRIDVCNG